MRALPPFLLLLAVKPIPDTYQSDQADYYLRYKANGFFWFYNKCWGQHRIGADFSIIFCKTKAYEERHRTQKCSVPKKLVDQLDPNICKKSGITTKANYPSLSIR